MKIISNHRELQVYQISFEVAMEIFELSKGFPIEEKYSLIDQIRRSSRSVSANISEAFSKRRYPKAFISKLSDSEAEAAETQTWLDFALECNYLSIENYERINQKYNHIIGKLVVMMNQSEKWSF